MALPAGFNRKRWMQEIASMGDLRRIAVVGVLGYGVFLSLGISAADYLRGRYLGRDFHFSWDNIGVAVVTGILFTAVSTDWR